MSAGVCFNMFKICIWFKTYKYEVIALIIDILLAVIAGLNQNNKSVLTGSLIIIIFSFFVVLYFRSKDKDFYFLPLDKPGQDSEWVGRGDWIYNRMEKCHEITKSNVGYLFPKTLMWDDYSFEFDFKIANKTCTWIVRAQNLSNYVMLQCANDGINPHIRLDGQWIVYTHNTTNMTFDNNRQLSYDKWYKAKIVCDKRSINVNIFSDNNKIFDRCWVIPDTLIWQVKKAGEEATYNIIRQIDFDFGGIGFRNDAYERAFIKNVYLEKI